MKTFSYTGDDPHEAAATLKCALDEVLTSTRKGFRVEVVTQVSIAQTFAPGERVRVEAAYDHYYNGREGTVQHLGRTQEPSIRSAVWVIMDGSNAAEYFLPGELVKIGGAS